MSGSVAFKTALLVYATLGLAYWLGQLFLIRRIIRSVPRLGDVASDGPVDWPKVSVIMPACNEAATLEAAVRARLADDYPNVEYILIDDRSEDGTGDLADRLAASDARLKVLRNRELPPGWLGKQYAMKLGAGTATGDWLLFSDVDVEHRPGALKRAMVLCRSRNLDHLAVLPGIYPSTVLVDCAMAPFLRMLCLMARAWAVEDPGSTAYFGVGAFNLVKRKAFDRTPGFEWLRLEPADDLALGQMLKSHGARSALAMGTGSVAVHWYRTFREMAVGSERATFASLYNFSLARALGFNLLFAAAELAPFAALAAPWPGIRYIGVATLLSALCASASVNRWMSHPLWLALLWPLGVLVMAAMGVRAGILGAARGGIRWRGTFYPTKALKPGRRL